MKLCPRCGSEKSIDQFSKSAKNCTGLQGYCRDCMTQASWVTTLKKRYGVTPEEYDAMYVSQDGRCQICLQHQSVFTKRLSVDHCHTTGKVRGLLCTNCNTAIGKLNDDISRLKRAITYLREEDTI